MATRWETFFFDGVFTKSGTKTLEERLTALGAQGWQLVSVVQRSSGGMITVFMQREIPDD